MTCKNSQSRYAHEDYDLANKQIKKLFGCELFPANPRDDLFFKGSYSCENGKSGTILHLKPVQENIQSFLMALRKGEICKSGGNCEKIFKFLKDDEKEKIKTKKAQWFSTEQNICLRI